MIFKLKLITLSFFSGFVLLIVLCLGAQNIKDRHSLKLGIATTAPLPTGFLIGTSLIVGVISGGTLIGLIIPSESNTK